MKRAPARLRSGSLFVININANRLPSFNVPGLSLTLLHRPEFPWLRAKNDGFVF